VFYKWRRRFDELGLEGLRDWSSRPRVCPNATRTEVVGKIIYLRQTYHFGPAKIAMYSSATTTFRSATRACGRSSNAWISIGSRLRSAPSATTGAGSVMRSPYPATACRST
jgi:hypothetical protein